MGFQFIWIDSLCVIQDDIEDWKIQSSMMGLIYKHAACNIAATWAADGSMGLFSNRHPGTVTPCATTLDDQRQPREYWISTLRGYHDDITNAPLNKRAWVLQERYLAAKQLSFSKRQVYWECPELTASEEFPSGVPRELWEDSDYGSRAMKLTGKPHMGVKDEWHARQQWAALVEQYSSCALTKTSDKMIALAGLAGEAQEAFGDAYLAGVWREDHRKQLCWRATEWDCQTLPGNRVPTWSRAKVDGPVVYDRSYYEPGTGDSLSRRS
ncbi:Uu.00g005730.m01.CDS01 [Anthostomella pinea]|uniref:Uu.00g005730.m01.CDS01 n=1 Tax=Anthostomella pinea TaxID=933095 RepID=A0AAI8VEU5_9PEZI|nr:Uu.00g005730.m01.CDS01 [Anthostomella pinea]